MGECSGVFRSNFVNLTMSAPVSFVQKNPAVPDGGERDGAGGRNP